MEYSIPEIIDRISILSLKVKKKNNPGLLSELEEYDKELKRLENKSGLKMKKNWLKRLNSVNLKMWDLFTVMEKAKEKSDYVEIGKIYIQLLILNRERTAIKNEIVDKTNDGFKDIKIN
jgi:hypothetical protein|tara:strand:- start:2825 stop:3181 length:357 start_codon:yes stop_codon:yes gene_type:complete